MAAHPMEKEFSVGIKYSLIAHVALVAIVLVKCLVFPGRTVMIAPTLRVDIVGLPDILKKDRYKMPNLPQGTAQELAEELKKAETEAKNLKLPEAQPEESEPDSMTFKTKGKEKPENRQKKLQTSLARIKALAKIADLETSQQGQLIKGNVISKGSSLSGDAREAEQASYYDALRERLQENWSLHKWLARQNLSAQVQVFIDGLGRLHSFRFLKLSGNAQFDSAVKRALVDSQPYPAPPKELRNLLLSDGILVGFPL